MKHNLKGLSLIELKEFIAECGKEEYRAKQLFKWIYEKSITNFNEMTNLSKKFREFLLNKAEIKSLKIIDSKKDFKDNTQKFLFKTDDDNFIETVIIPDKNRNTICVSSQIGCPLDCKFCITGQKLKYKRNLNAFEIIDQIFYCRKILAKEKSKITNVVFMGIGEPFLNFDNVIKVCDILNAEIGFNLAAKRITISTSGLVPEIYKLADYPKKYLLAISLHSTINKTRNKLMPINKKYPLEELTKALKYFNNKKKDISITLEYSLMKNINDDKTDLESLIKYCKKLKCKVNLIVYNSTDTLNYKRTDEEITRFFFKTLNQQKIRTTTRFSRGENINGACGQLVNKNFSKKINY